MALYDDDSGAVNVILENVAVFAGPKGLQGEKGDKGDKGDAGAGINWLGAWSAGTYAEFDAVSHQGSSYVANTTTTDEPPGPDWDVLSAASTGNLAAANNLSDVANTATAFNNIKQAATTSATGVVELATTTETLTGTDTSRAVTPDSLAALWEQGSDIASASTISFGEGGFFRITGVTTISTMNFGTDKAGRRVWVEFTGALTLTNSANLVLPRGANIKTAAGDRACFQRKSGSVTMCLAYIPATMDGERFEYTVKNVAALTAAIVPSTVDAVNVLGYTTAGDGGGAIYIRVGSEPTHLGKAQSADGAWWAIQPFQELHFEMFGTIPDQISTSQQANMQKCFDFIDTNGYGVVRLLPGRYYYLTSTTSGNNATNIGLRVYDNTTILGPGEFRCNRISSNANRLVVLSILGSYVTIDGVTFRNVGTITPGVQSTSNDDINFGDRNDPLSADIPEQTDIKVLNTKHFNSFYPINVAITEDSTKVIRDILFQNMTIVGNPDSKFSGAVNFINRSLGYRLYNLRVIGNHISTISNSGGVNIYGVKHFTVIGNTVQDCIYAGIQTENESQYGVIANNTVLRAGRGIWTDDSADIVIANNTVIAETSVPPEGSAEVREGIFITRQGTSTTPSWVTSNIRVIGNHVKDGRIRSAIFSGDGGTSSFGFIEVSHNTVSWTSQSDMESSSISLIAATEKIVSFNRLRGGSTQTILLSNNAGERVTLVGNITAKANAESNVGINMTGSSAQVIMGFNNFVNGVGTLEGIIQQYGNIDGGEAYGPVTIRCTVSVSGGTPTLQEDEGISSISDSGDGILTVNFSNSFATTQYTPFVSGLAGGSRMFRADIQSAGSIRLVSTNTTPAASDPTKWYFMAIGYVT